MSILTAFNPVTLITGGTLGGEQLGILLFDGCSMGNKKRSHLAPFLYRKIVLVYSGNAVAYT